MAKFGAEKGVGFSGFAEMLEIVNVYISRRFLQRMARGLGGFHKLLLVARIGEALFEAPAPA